ncbi:hypothetical protein BJ508DRAFT_362853 [Ascobolus immersus RN42]|uniref:Uncharacterized protein n=1 Tax=Ascobolus immersus RN42 TaxID=1160509 RepID=A0A3N4I3B9_ASCIM|nr:hypothetical protein BJ508DRAFT_362853 [Ascobolus immersus RN42]
MLLSKKEALVNVGPYTKPSAILLRAGVEHVIWGDHCLAFAFGFRQHLKLKELDILVADKHMTKAVEALQSCSYQIRKEQKVGMFGMVQKIGVFPEIAVLDFSASNPSKPDSNSFTPRPINLIPASLVHFRMDAQEYKSRSFVELPKVSSSGGWNVSLPTLPGVLDAALTLMRLNFYKNLDLDCPHNAFENTPQFYKLLSPGACRKEALWRHGREIWMQVQSQAYGREDFAPHNALGSRPSKRKMMVANLLGIDNLRYYAGLCIDEELDEAEKLALGEQDYDSSDYSDMLSETAGVEVFGRGKTWESHFGVTAVPGAEFDWSEFDLSVGGSGSDCESEFKNAEQNPESVESSFVLWQRQRK